jgi:hypothetical protein
MKDKILKSDKSCISNPKSEISDWTQTWLAPQRSNKKFRISDLRCRIRPISKSPQRSVDMKSTGSLAFLALLALIAVTVPVLAHHSFEAEYDRSKPFTFTGTVTKVEWMNPHARFYVDVKDKDGAVVNWDFELGPPNSLMRRGWNRNSLKPGDSVTVTGFLSKLSKTNGNATTVTLGDGRKVFAGSSADGAPTQ